MGEKRIDVEICVEASDKAAVQQAAAAASAGGAARIELCADMGNDGLTPAVDLIRVARAALHGRTQLQVMIRPRGGDFAYSKQELELMKRQIGQAVDAGADGVVLGVVENGRIPAAAVQPLLQLAHQAGCPVTFHRAFDTVADSAAALETLIDLGIQRVLTSGTSWESRQPVFSGLAQIQALLELADGRIELVLGGGIQINNVQKILHALHLGNNLVSVHAYSGVLVAGQTSATAVAQLCSAASVDDDGRR